MSLYLLQYIAILANCDLTHSSILYHSPCFAYASRDIRYHQTDPKEQDTSPTTVVVVLISIMKTITKNVIEWKK